MARQGFIKLLEAEDIGLLTADKIHHFRAMPRRPPPVEEIIEAADVPGENAKAAGRLVLAETIARMQRQETMDIRPAYQQGHKRQYRPAAKGPDEQRYNEKDYDEQ
jgi:hypothetical protein